MALTSIVAAEVGDTLTPFNEAVYAGSEAACAPTSWSAASGTINTAWPVATNAATGDSAVTITNISSEIVGNFAYPQPGDLVLIMQIADATINTTDSTNYGGDDGTATGYTDIGNSGQYEFARVANFRHSSGTVTFDRPILNRYRATGISRAQMVYVPEYTNLKLTGQVDALPYTALPDTDRIAGGVVAMRVTGTLDLAGYSINADYRGFPGGAKAPYTYLNTHYPPIHTPEYVTDTPESTPRDDDGANAGKGVGIAGGDCPKFCVNGVAPRGSAIEVRGSERIHINDNYIYIYEGRNPRDRRDAEVAAVAG